MAFLEIVDLTCNLIHQFPFYNVAILFLTLLVFSSQPNLMLACFVIQILEVIFIIIVLSFPDSLYCPSTHLSQLLIFQYADLSAKWRILYSQVRSYLAPFWLKFHSFGLFVLSVHLNLFKDLLYPFRTY